MPPYKHALLVPIDAENLQITAQHTSNLPTPTADYMDLSGNELIREDLLSPLIIKRRAMLPPAASIEEQDEAVLEIPRKRRKRYSKAETICSILETLSDAGLTPATFLIAILEAGAEQDDVYGRSGEAFFRSTNVENIRRVLDLILANQKGAVVLNEWMMPHAVDLVCETVHREMEAAKPHLHMTIAETTPEFIESWDLNSIMDPISEKITPTWTAVLSAASESKVCLAKGAGKNTQCRHTVRFIFFYDLSNQHLTIFDRQKI